MTEKERMISGKLYDPGNRTLRNERKHASMLTYKYNHTQDKETQKEILQSLLGSIKGQITIEPPFHCDYGSNIHVGDQFFANYGFTVLDCAPIIFGDNCLCGPNVSLYTAIHPIDATIRNTGVELAKPISIGNNVWIGGSVTINPGVSIGDNTIIGAGSIVTKDIPADCIAVGCPAKVLRMITEEDRQYWEAVYQDYIKEQAQ